MMFALPPSKARFIPECPQVGSPICRILFPSTHFKALGPQGLLAIPPGCHCSLCTVDRSGKAPRKLRVGKFNKPSYIESRFYTQSNSDIECSDLSWEPNYARDSIAVSLSEDFTVPRNTSFSIQRYQGFHDKISYSRLNDLSVSHIVNHSQAYHTTNSQQWHLSIPQQHTINLDLNPSNSNSLVGSFVQTSAILSSHGSVLDQSQAGTFCLENEQGEFRTKYRGTSSLEAAPSTDWSFGMNFPPAGSRKSFSSVKTSVQLKSLKPFTNPVTSPSPTPLEYENCSKDHLHYSLGLVTTQPSAKFETTKLRTCRSEAGGASMFTPEKEMSIGVIKGTKEEEHDQDDEEEEEDEEGIFVFKAQFIGKGMRLLPKSKGFLLSPSPQKKHNQRIRSITYRPPNSSEFIFIKPVTVSTFQRKRARLGRNHIPSEEAKFEMSQ